MQLCIVSKNRFFRRFFRTCYEKYISAAFSHFKKQFLVIVKAVTYSRFHCRLLRAQPFLGSSRNAPSQEGERSVTWRPCYMQTRVFQTWFACLDSLFSYNHKAIKKVNIFYLSYVCLCLVGTLSLSIASVHSFPVKISTIIMSPWANHGVYLGVRTWQDFLCLLAFVLLYDIV